MSEELESVRGDFWDAVLDERDRQTAMWGTQTHSGHAWTGILTEEVGEFAAAVNDERHEEALDELIQVAAVCLSAYEQSQLRRGLEPAWGDFG